MTKIPTVTPVTHYTAPLYPDYTAPNPITSPSAYPYPHRKNPILVATAVGALLSTTAFADKKEDCLNMVTNPLSVASSGLPYTSSPFGTGSPDRIPEKIARKLIMQVFSEEGIKLQEKVQYKKEGAEFITSGYNTKRKIGYIWGDWNSLDHIDAIQSWDRLENEEDVDAEYLEYFVKDTSFKNRIAKAKTISNEKDRQVSLLAILKEYKAKLSKTRISLEEAKSLEDKAKESGEYIALISQFDQRFEFYSWSEDNKVSIEDLAKIKDPIKRAAAYKVAKKDTALKAMNRLEEAVRGYIKWARTQGF
ncbi:MAG: hypothetical protein HQL32_08235 [Planctomycetes bacterium]|nr:hypothetical protein [Planctomycetota bacterium]